MKNLTTALIEEGKQKTKLFADIKTMGVTTVSLLALKAELWTLTPIQMRSLKAMTLNPYGTLYLALNFAKSKPSPCNSFYAGERY